MVRYLVEVVDKGGSKSLSIKRNFRDVTLVAALTLIQILGER